MRGTTNIPAVCVVVRRDNKILFVMRSHTGWQDGKYSLPAGHVEHGESFKISSAREALEEVNVTVVPDKLRHVFTMQTYQGESNIRVHAFFEADEWSGEPKNMEPEIHAEIKWFDVHELPYDEIIDFQAQALKGILAGESYSESGWDESTTL